MMNAHKLRTLSRGGNFFPPASALLFLIVVVFGFASGSARSQQEDTPADERKFEDTVPAHVPVKVKLKSEKSFKDLGNKGWARELEIEVKNTGTKPIYFMFMNVVMSDFILGNGYPLAFQVRYGRVELKDLERPLEPNDKPLLPGEIVVFKIPESQVRGYEATREEENKEDPKKVKFHLQLINFGDGTGMIGINGSPLPIPVRKRAQASPPPKITSGADRGLQALPAISDGRLTGPLHQSR